VLWSTQDFRCVRKTPQLRVNEYTARCVVSTPLDDLDEANLF
jgi:hypothetical protein